MKRKLTDELIIRTVKNHPNQTQTQLAELMDCSNTTVSNNISKLVNEGKIRQEVDINGVYHYTMPEYKFTCELPVKVVDTHNKFVQELKAEFRANLDKRVRAYLNEQYKKIMADLIQDLGL